MSVISAFNNFQRDSVNLDSARNKKARNSRDWLIDQINGFSDFFPLYSAMHISFGSFARKTKIRPLDDIDLMFAMMGAGCTYEENIFGTVTVKVPIECSAYSNYCHPNTQTLNSIKVVNEFVRKLAAIPQYKNAQTKRNQEAAVLNLTSYDWVFDIVPCFFTSEDNAGRSFFLIPDGSGNWKKTDPKIDRQRVTTINTNGAGNVLNVLRLIKYWQKRSTMPAIGSYLLECMILDYYETNSSCSAYQDLEIPELLNYISSAIYGSVNDPKFIQGDLNTLDFDTKFKVSQRASADRLIAIEAREAEADGDIRKSIRKWRDIFGNNFPKYG